MENYLLEATKKQDEAIRLQDEENSSIFGMPWSQSQPKLLPQESPISTNLLQFV